MDTVKLIATIKSCPILWDCSRGKRKRDRDDAWKEVASQVSLWLYARKRCLKVYSFVKVPSADLFIWCVLC